MPQHSVYLSGAVALRVFLCFACGYMLSYAFRSINAVIGPALLTELGLSNSDLGLLSSAYFASFAALQLPLGIWLDKYGARRTESALLLFAAAGAAVFAMSDTLSGLWVGRAMIGVGVSACLMAPYKAYRQWFAPQRQSQLASWMLMAGTLGALMATVPVAMALPFIGWRGVFFIMAGLILLVAAAIFFLVRDGESEQEKLSAAASEAAQRPAAAGEAAAQGQGYWQIFSHPYFRRLALIGMANQGSFVALQTLWAGPWMTTVLGMSKEQTAQILFIFNLCLLLSHLGVSWWAPRYVSYAGGPGWPVLRVISIGLAGSIIAQCAMLLVISPWAWLFWIMMAVCGTVMTLTQTQVGLSFPPSLAGRANTAYNLLLFIGAFLVQWGIGLLIDVFAAGGASHAGAMRAAFGLCLALQSASLASFMLGRASSSRTATLA